jgi:hypothetical protein
MCVISVIIGHIWHVVIIQHCVVIDNVPLGVRTITVVWPCSHLNTGLRELDGTDFCWATFGIHSRV